MSENPLYSADALEGLGSELKVFSREDSPLAKYLGTICVDPGVKLYDPNGLVKPYAMLGGFIMPYEPGGKDQLVADITTALTVKRNAEDPAEIIFIMGHQDCKYAGVLYNTLCGSGDKFPIRKKFVEALIMEPELHNILEKSVKAANEQKQNPDLIIRALTEMMLIESLRNFRKYIVDNNGNTIAQYMDGKVKDTPQLSVMPIFALGHGNDHNNADILYFDPSTYRFLPKNQIDAKKKTGKSIDEILDIAREKYAERMQKGDYSHLVMNDLKSAKHCQNC